MSQTKHHTRKDREGLLLKEVVSKITVSKDNPHEDAGVIMRNCTQAEVEQKNWRSI